MKKELTAGLILFVLTVSVGCQGGLPIGQEAFKQSMIGSMFTAQSSSSPGNPFLNSGPPAQLQGTTMTNGHVIVERNHPQQGTTVSNSAPAIVNVGLQRQPDGPFGSPPPRSTGTAGWQSSQYPENHAPGIATVPY